MLYCFSVHTGVSELVDHLFRREAARMTASLVRVFGMSRVELVEDVVQEALLEALRHWRFEGIPDNPGAWLTRVAQRRAIDALRRDAALQRLEPSLRAWAGRARAPAHDAPDEQLRLMFACCHPRLPRESRIALTLRMVGGFGVPEIARAFLIGHEAASQRLVRARRAVREEGIPLEFPDEEGIGPRLDGVLEVIYLMYNEGYTAHGGDELIRREFVEEACRLTLMLLSDARTARPPVHALLALILFQSARLEARTAPDGGIVLLDAQDRARWDAGMIARGFHHLRLSAAGDRLTTYHLEGAIAAVHARARSFEETDWEEIVSLYDLLRGVRADAVVALNRAVAIAMARGPEAGLDELRALEREDRTEGYFPLAAARGEILVRAGRHAEGAAAFRRALGLGCSEPERAMLLRKLESAELAASRGPLERHEQGQHEQC